MELDIGCGRNKWPGAVGLDRQPLDGVDIVHDVFCRPWPLPAGSVRRAYCHHFLEHVPRVMVGPEGTSYPFLEFMNEAWRILAPEGELCIEMPLGDSQAFLQDPTHCNPCNAATFLYFDPEDPARLWDLYRPKPWRIVSNLAADGSLTVILAKRGGV